MKVHRVQMVNGIEYAIYRCERHGEEWSENDLGCPDCIEEWNKAIEARFRDMGRVRDIVQLLNEQIARPERYYNDAVSLILTGEMLRDELNGGYLDEPTEILVEEAIQRYERVLTREVPLITRQSIAEEVAFGLPTETSKEELRRMLRGVEVMFSSDRR